MFTEDSNLKEITKLFGEDYMQMEQKANGLIPKEKIEEAQEIYLELALAVLIHAGNMPKTVKIKILNKLRNNIQNGKI